MLRGPLSPIAPPSPNVQDPHSDLRHGEINMPTPVAAACGCSAAKVCVDTAVGAVCATLPVAAPLAPVIIPVVLVAAAFGLVAACLSGDEKRRT